MRPDIDLRSYLDTRGGAVTLIVSLVVLVLTAAAAALGQAALMDPGVVDVELTMIVLVLPLSLIIPVIVVAVMAGEWSDRSIQVTLLQRPGRLALLAAKSLAALVLTALVTGLAIGLAAAATWAGGELLGEGSSFESFRGVMTTQLSVLLVTALFALVMGALTQSTVLGLVAAIGVPFVVATAAGVVTLTGSQLAADIVAALDLQTAAVQIADGAAGAEVLWPIALLLVLPLLGAVLRWSRREI